MSSAITLVAGMQQLAMERPAARGTGNDGDLAFDFVCGRWDGSH
jgi:hypothetical protein